MDLYRVTVRTTSSLQPDSSTTYWSREVLYCGVSRDEARAAYHCSTPRDFSAGYGNKARETVMAVIRDAETDDFWDDIVEHTDD